jgi:ribonuclease BN (tRNA processing enzyme)
MIRAFSLRSSYKIVTDPNWTILLISKGYSLFLERLMLVNCGERDLNTVLLSHSPNHQVIFMGLTSIAEDLL